MKDEKVRLVFEELRKIIDSTARIQICEHNMGSYTDYKCIEDVPHNYDNREVFGIGIVNSEYSGTETLNTGRYAYAIEVRLL